MVDAASVIFYVFLVGGAFAVVERTGALARLVNGLAAAGRAGASGDSGRQRGVRLGGILIQMQEELIAFVPVLLLCWCAGSASPRHRGGHEPRRRGGRRLVQSDQSVPGRHRPEGGRATARRRGWASAWRSCSRRWSSGSPARCATAHRRPAGSSPAAEARAPRRTWRDLTILLAILAAFVIFVVGAQRLGWDFEQLAALFFVMGVLAGGARPAGPGRHGGRLRRGVPVDGLRRAPDRIRPGDLRRARRGAHRGHHRPRTVHPDRGAAHHPLGARHDGRPQARSTCRCPAPAARRC